MSSFLCGELALIVAPEHGGPLPVRLLVVGDEGHDSVKPGLGIAVL
jgi:hypothetical protein